MFSLIISYVETDIDIMWVQVWLFICGWYTGTQDYNYIQDYAFVQTIYIFSDLYFLEILPFIKHEPQGLDKPLPVTASVTTLPINTVLCRPPAVVQVAQLPVPSTQTHPLKQLEELHSPLTNMEMDFAESTPGSDSNLHNEDGMDWLDVADTLTHVSIFSSDFLDSHDMHLNWE